MRMSTKRTIVSSALFLALALILPGCSTSAPKIKPVAWNVKITKKTPASIEVDVIGVTEQEKTYYDSLAMDGYWKANSQVRRDADKITKVLEEDQPWIISQDDPKWIQWKNRGVTTLLVVANLPVADGLWKVPLTLDKKSWDAKNRTIEIEIQNTLIRVQTPRRIRN
jgi:hypothetical protein